jgi:AraC-like DNA-binding protein
METVPTVVVRSVAKIAASAAPRGNPDRLLGTIGLDREALDEWGLRIPYADMMMLSEHAARMTEDTAFGLHVGERIRQSEYGIIGRLTMTSSTLGDALRSLVRYLPIWTNVGVFKLDIEGPVAHFRWQYSRVSLPENRHDCEMSMATVMCLNRLARGAGWRPREVWFQHARPGNTDEHARIFRAPVRFGMSATALLLDRQSLEVPLKTARPGTNRSLAKIAERLLLDTRSETSFARGVLSFIRQNFGKGPFDLEDAAHELGVSRRTLQRKLKEESASYRGLVQQARQHYSHHLLLDTPMTATAMAYALGYSEPSVFHRAFHKWHGKAPGEFRRN